MPSNQYQLNRDSLAKLFYDNWKSYIAQKNQSDNRTKFEMLFNCFEYAGKYLSNKEGEALLKWLSINKNLISESFNSMYPTSVYTLEEVKAYKKLQNLWPIVNNSNGYEIALSNADENPSNGFFGSLFIIKDNLRHESYEFTESFEEILSLTNILLESTMFGTFLNLSKKELQKIETLKQNKEKRESVVIKIIMFFVIALSLMWLFSGKDNSKVITIDCEKNPNSKYCDGSYEYQIMEDSAKEDNFYQNIVR